MPLLRDQDRRERVRLSAVRGVDLMTCFRCSRNKAISGSGDYDVPDIPEGLPAIEELIGQGVNVALLFAVKSYVFIQVVDEPSVDLPIPEKPYTFRRLLDAQSAGDLQALRVARVRLSDLVEVQ